jgi:hypothetical protein
MKELNAKPPRSKGAKENTIFEPTPFSQGGRRVGDEGACSLSGKGSPAVLRRLGDEGITPFSLEGRRVGDEGKSQ